MHNNRRTIDGDHWRKYAYSNEAPPLAADTVDHLEFTLRSKFPEVFQAATERRRLRELPRTKGGIA